MKSIVFPHPPQSIGGPRSFQLRFEKYLILKGWNISYAGDGIRPDIIFVVGGTRRILWLCWQKLLGVKIVVRLDGINWQHRVYEKNKFIYLVKEIHNIIINVIRKYIADCVIYQSLFIRDWWCIKYGNVNKIEKIIYNGVDLNRFVPINKMHCITNEIKIICVEGCVHGDPAINILKNIINYQVEIYGHVDEEMANKILKLNRNNIKICGVAPQEEIHNIYSGCCIYLSLELNPPCPNSVIEAMACGVPVIGYNSGSFSELVSDECGVILPYISNPWKLESPNTDLLEYSIKKIQNNYYNYSNEARKRVELLFSLEYMGKSYCDIFKNL